MIQVLEPTQPLLEPLLGTLLSLLEQRVGLRLAGSAPQILAAFQTLAGELQLSANELLERLRDDLSLLEALAAQLTIPETHFFRIAPQIEALSRTVLPDLERRVKGRRSLRFWSAACSTGEEAYTLAILATQLGLADVRVLGTDLRPQSLEVARLGSYRAWSFRDTPEHVRERYFRRADSAKNHSPTWQIAPELRQAVRFETHNLLSNDWSVVERCDLILCRNVMIYFANLTAQLLIERLAAQLQPEGWLMLGPSDPPPLPATLERSALIARYVGGAIVYQKRADGWLGSPARAPSPVSVDLPPLEEGLLLGLDQPSLEGRTTVHISPSTVSEDRGTNEFEQQLQLGMNALELADLPAALGALRCAVYLEPHSALAQFLLAKTLNDSAQLGRARAALRQAQRLLEGSDESSDLHRAINALVLELGQP